MALEIERRFLVAGEAWRPLVVWSQSLDQGYLLASAATRKRRSISSAIVEIPLGRPCCHGQKLHSIKRRDPNSVKPRRW